MIYFKASEEDRERYEISIPDGFYLDLRNIDYGDQIDWWTTTELFEAQEVPAYLCHRVKDFENKILDTLKKEYLELINASKRHKKFAIECIDLTLIHDYKGIDFVNQVNKWIKETDSLIAIKKEEIITELNKINITTYYQVERQNSIVDIFLELENAKDSIIKSEMMRPIAFASSSRPSEYSIRAELNTRMRYKDTIITKITI